MAKGAERLIANNKKARHDYFIEDTYEAGIVLHGTEVKSLRQGHCSIKEAFVRVDGGEVISALMKREIFLTKTRCARKNSCFTATRLTD